jgi:multidrug efflux pump subunit AcrA (membrane-fusion protein)
MKKSKKALAEAEAQSQGPPAQEKSEMIKGTEGARYVELDEEDRNTFTRLFDAQEQLQAQITGLDMQIKRLRSTRDQLIEQLEELSKQIQQEFRIADSKYGMNKTNAAYRFNRKEERFERID